MKQRSGFLALIVCCVLILTCITTLLPSGTSPIVYANPKLNAPNGTQHVPRMFRAPKSSTVRYADVQVDTNCAGEACANSSLAEANTTRKLAVGADGSIYATYWNESGIYVAKSTNRGQTFSSPVRVTLVPTQAEIAVSGDGTLYVIYGNAGYFYITESSNGGTTWSDPVTVGTGSGSIHMAVDGDYVYAVNQSGTTLYHSSDGASTWSTTTVGTVQAFSDIRVDPLTHNVYVFTDNPSVYWYVSTDHGATLGSKNDTEKSVFFSTGALSSDGTNTYFYMAGANLMDGGSTTNLERINLTSKAVDTKTIDNTVAGMTRALAADGCGNIVSGSKQSSTNNLLFQYSTDAGTTFSASEQVVAAGSRESVAINITNGDLLYLYEKAGHIYLTTYKDVFTAGSSCYALNLSLTAVEFTRPGEQPQILLTNTSSTSMSITSIVISGTAFTLSNTCGTSLAAGASCIVTVSGTTVASEILTITVSVGTSIVKKIPINLGESAALRPTATPVPTTAVPGTATKTATSTQTATGTATNTKTATITNTITNTKTATTTKTATATMTSSKTVTVTNTATNTRTSTATNTATSTRTSTATKTATATNTATNTATATKTPTSTKTATDTATPSNTRTSTPTPQSFNLRKAAVGNLFVIGILQNGALVSWGISQPGMTQSVIPATYRGMQFIDVAASIATVYVLRADGNLYAWGQNNWGQTDIPVSAQTGVKAIGAGSLTGYAIKTDGSVVAWGANDKGQLSIPAGATNVVAIDGGDGHVLAVKADGTVIGWGDFSSGQSTVPPGLSGVVAVSAGKRHSLALLNTGRVVGWGDNTMREINIPATAVDIVSISAGRDCSLAVKADGTLITWGDPAYTNFDPAVTNAVAVASDNQNSIAGLRNGGVAVAGNFYSDVNVSRTPTPTP